MARTLTATGAPSLVLSEVLVAEHYLPDADPLRADALMRLLRASAGLRHALFLPADETYFAVYDGTSAAAVRAATAGVARPGSSLDRIVRAVLLAPARALNSIDMTFAEALTTGDLKGEGRL